MTTTQMLTLEKIEQHARFNRYHLSWLSIFGLISTIAICWGVFQLHLLLAVLTAF